MVSTTAATTRTNDLIYAVIKKKLISQKIIIRHLIFYKFQVPCHVARALRASSAVATATAFVARGAVIITTTAETARTSSTVSPMSAGKIGGSVVQVIAYPSVSTATGLESDCFVLLKNFILKIKILPIQNLIYLSKLSGLFGRDELSGEISGWQVLP
jgi:hypothetical protein